MTIDEQHIQRALGLARAGVGLVSPNPAVGTIVLDASGREVGTGTHTYDGIQHAEVLALEQAGNLARGGTLYLNFEPCSHQGRTPPCADAVIAAGIARVVCSMTDPNPKVAGQGFARLRAAGIKVEVGLFAAEAKKLNESFAKYIRRGKPLVTRRRMKTRSPLPTANGNQGQQRKGAGQLPEVQGWPFHLARLNLYPARCA